MTEEDNRMLAMRGAMLEALKKAGEKGDAVQESQKLDENKLIYRAEKLGKGWSNWINSASLKSWRELDPKIVNDWTTLAVQISGIEQDSSNRAIARIAKGMGLQGDKLVKAGASNHNKIAFLYDGFNFGRRHLIVGLETMPLLIEIAAVPSGSFLVASLAHLSELESGSLPLQLLSKQILDVNDNRGELSLGDSCDAIGGWINKSEVRAYFSERKLISKLF